MSNAVSRFAGDEDQKYKSIDEQFRAVPPFTHLGPDQGEADSVRDVYKWICQKVDFPSNEIKEIEKEDYRTERMHTINNI